MLKAKYIPYTFHFKMPGGTSRGVLNQKQSWIIQLWNCDRPEKIGWGEVSIIEGLSPDNRLLIEPLLDDFCNNPLQFRDNTDLKTFPALKFGIETAFRDLDTGGIRVLYPSNFTKGEAGIIINGLVWMGDIPTMLKRLEDKMASGFKCIKIKVGALNFEDELHLLSTIRKKYPASEIEIRVDANGAFAPEEALSKIESLVPFELHSIEQPIKPANWKTMANLCKISPIPIALDEELIGITNTTDQLNLLQQIKPQFLILKPSLLGGLNETTKWTKLANEQNVGWWVTSALEGNIGLNAIAQWTYLNGSQMPQGLGTGTVFSNNIPSPLEIRGQALWYNKNLEWDLNKVHQKNN